MDQFKNPNHSLPEKFKTDMPGQTPRPEARSFLHELLIGHKKTEAEPNPKVEVEVVNEEKSLFDKKEGVKLTELRRLAKKAYDSHIHLNQGQRVEVIEELPKEGKKRVWGENVKKWFKNSERKEKKGKEVRIEEEQKQKLVEKLKRMKY